MAGRADPRLVEVWVTAADGTVGFATGYRIAPRLVLTAGHALRSRGDVQVRLAGDATLRPCAPVWQRDDDRVDAALLELPETPPGGPVPPPRWGRLTGGAPGTEAVLTGFPDARTGPGQPRRPAQVRGHINPGSEYRRGWYVFDVDDAVPADRERWQGISGSPVLAGDLLVGVVADRVLDYDSRQLAAVPIEAVLRERGFAERVARHAGAAPVLESVELRDLFAPPVNPARGLRSPAELLRAEVEVVRFRGREQVLESARAWCESGFDGSSGDAAEERGDFRVRLVVGPAGQGKSRFARRLVGQMSRRGWVAGRLARQPTADELAPLAATAVPVLLVIDYAEAQRDAVHRIVELFLRRRGTVPVRLLLLARSAGEWWEVLRHADGDLDGELSDASVTDLPPLDPHAHARPAVFRQVTADLAARLPEVPGYAGADWAALARELPVPELGDDRYANPLTMQMEALTRLLQAGPARVETAPDPSPEQVLVAHEARYWGASARARDLVFRDPRTYQEAAAAAVLVPVGRFDDARELLGAVPSLVGKDNDVLGAVAGWLRDLYPPGGAAYWGFLQPDRLAEFLVGTTVARSGRFLADVLAAAGRLGAPAVGHAIAVLARAAIHQEHLAEPLRSLVVARPDELAVAAATVATETEQPAPLLDAIGEIVAGAATLDLDLVRALLVAIPSESHRLTRVAVRLSTALCDRLAGAEADPLVRALQAHAQRLFADKQGPAAVAAASQAVELARTLTDRALLAGALTSLSVYRRGTDDSAGAVAAGREAVALAEELAGQDPGEHLPLLARTLGNLSKAMTALGRPEEARQVVQQAIDRLRRPTPGRPEQYRQDLARLLLDLSSVLNAGQLYAEAESVVEEAVSILRDLTGDDPTGARRQQLASALRFLVIVRWPLRRYPEALDAAVRSVAIYRELVALRPDPYRAYLAVGLRDVATTLDVMDRTDEALEAFAETVDTYRLLADANPTLYLARFAKVAQDLALRHTAREPAKGIPAGRAAVAAHRELAALGEPAYEVGLAEALKILSRQPALDDEESIELGREAAGIYERLAGTAPGIYRPSFAQALVELADTLLRAGREPAAMASLERARALFRELVEAGTHAAFRQYQYTEFKLADRLLLTGEAARAGRALDAMAALCLDCTARATPKQARAYTTGLYGAIFRLLKAGEVAAATARLDDAEKLHRQYFGSAVVGRGQLNTHGHLLAEVVVGLHRAGERDRAARAAADLLVLARTLWRAAGQGDLRKQGNLYARVAQSLKVIGAHGPARTVAGYATATRAALVRDDPAQHVQEYASARVLLAVCEALDGDPAASWHSFAVAIRCWTLLTGPDREARRATFGSFLAWLPTQLTEIGRPDLARTVAARAAAEGWAGGESAAG